MWKKEEEALPTDAMSTIVKARAFRGGLFLGGIKSAKDFPLLKSERVTAVLTVANDVFVDYEGTDIRHLHIKVKDTQFEDLSKHFNETTEFIHEELSKGNVLVHCRLGVSRSATIILAYLMRFGKLTYEQAFQRLKNKRFEINPIAAFRQQLQKYEKILQPN